MGYHGVISTIGYHGGISIIGGADAPMASLLLGELLSFAYSAGFLLLAALEVGGYVLQAWSLYTIAKRRGIRHPWLAWIPVLNRWILGSVSDQYQYVTARKVKNKRKWLLGLSAAPAVLTIVGIVLAGVFIFSILAYGYSGANGWDGYATGGIGSLLGMIAVYLAIAGISVAVAVLQYIALNDLYKSCDPANSTAYLILSIFIPASLPILLFLCRNKDAGMPPRKPQSIPENFPEEDIGS